MPTKGVHTMPGATPRYPPEFKREAVRLVRSSPNRSIAQIARELGISDNSLRSWIKQFEIDQGESAKGLQPRSARNSGSSVKRTKSCVRSGRSSEKPRPFSRGKMGSGEAVQASSMRRRPAIRSRYCAGYLESQGAATMNG